MVRIIPTRLKSYGGTSNSSSSLSTSPKPTMQKRDLSPGATGGKANGLMLRIVVLRVGDLWPASAEARWRHTDRRLLGQKPRC
jgi:hypothetical protein